MQRSSVNIQAFLVATAVGCAALAAFLFFWYQVKVPFLRTEEFILALASVAIALLTVIVFQSFRVSETASAIAKSMAEDKLLTSHDLFTELYRNSPVPYFVIDKRFTVDSANLAAVRLFGVDLKWFEGKNVFEHMESDNAARIGLIRQYFGEQIPVNAEEVEIIRPDGDRRWVMLSLFAFKDAERQKKGLLTLVDITKQKEIDKAKTEFVSLASHQLRTPITAMKWNIELLQGSGDDRFTEEEKTYVEKITRGVERMDLLVTDFLSVSKLELGTFEPHLEPVLFETFMDSILESYDKISEVRQITIERAWDPQLTLQTDAHLLEMALSNLISNALKYTPDGGTVRIASEAREGRHLLSVSDTGMGIPHGEQERVFTKIFRASNAKAEVPEGTGLGLYIARESVRVLGGDIVFVSEEGKGTTFTILLP